MSNEEAINVILNIRECNCNRNCDMECQNCSCNYSNEELQDALALATKVMKGE